MKAIQKRRAAAGQSGFTLIELLVVIAILGILAAVVVFAVGNTTDTARKNACKVEKRTLQTAIEAYNGVTGAYPADFNEIMDHPDAARFLEDMAAADRTELADKWEIGTGSNGQPSVVVVADGPCDFA